MKTAFNPPPKAYNQQTPQTVKKDDLVERVIESIKVLNKKEEETKQSISQQKSSQAKPKQTALIKEEISQSLQPQQQMRKRTNTLTVGERPNLTGPNIQN